MRIKLIETKFRGEWGEQDKKDVRSFLLKHVDILVDGVRSTLIPLLVDSLLRGHDVQIFTELA